MNTPAEIRNLQFSIQTKKQVLRLYVAMYDMLGVQVHQRIGHLVDIACAPLLAKASEFAQLTIQLAFAGKLEHEKDTLLVMEVTIKAKDIWMAEVLLDFNLASSLFLNAVVDDFGFVEGFERDYIVWLDLGADHVYTAEFSFA